MVVKRKRRGEIAWSKVTPEIERKCVLMNIYGDTGTGRTTLALTAPGPIAFIYSSLEKVEGILQRFADKDVRKIDFGGYGREGSQKEIAEAADEHWRLLKAAWGDAFGWARTIVLDTHTEAWELIRLARFGGLKPSGGRVDANYGPVNAEWRGLFRQQRTQSDVNVIVIGQTKDEYTSAPKGKMGQRTGLTIQAGQKEIPFMADAIVRTSRGVDGLFKGVVEKGWYNAYCEGMELEDEESTFAGYMEFVSDFDRRKWE